MKNIILNLSAPFMTFGNDDVSYMNITRETGEFPTISSIYGILCSCFGNRGDESFIKEIRQFIVNFDSYALHTKTSILKDFQCIGNGWVGIDKRMHFNKGDCVGKIKHKYYLENPHFMVILDVCDDDFAARVAKWLDCPYYKNIWIGSKNCVPDEYFFGGIYSTKEETIREINKHNPTYLYTSNPPNQYDMVFENIKDIPFNSLKNKDSYLIRNAYKINLL